MAKLNINKVKKVSEQLLTINELSEKLKVSTGTIYQWVHKGEIPHVKIGRSLRFKTEDIETYINNNRNAVEVLDGNV